MNKKELIKQVASDTGFSQKECIIILNSAFKIICNQLKLDRKVCISNFGTFKKIHYNQKRIRNIHTGALQNNHASASISFKASQNLKNSL